MFMNVYAIQTIMAFFVFCENDKKKFVDFIEDNVQTDSSISKNYTSAFTNIIKTVIGNKTDGAKYTNL